MPRAGDLVTIPGIPAPVEVAWVVGDHLGVELRGYGVMVIERRYCRAVG